MNFNGFTEGVKAGIGISICFLLAVIMISMQESISILQKILTEVTK